MPNKKKTVLQREQELAERIMQQVNQGIDDCFENFKRIMERMASASDQNSPTTRPGTSKKRPGEQDSPEDSPAPKVSKTVKNQDSNPSSHSSFSAVAARAEPSQAQTPAPLTRQSEQATPSHPADCFAEPWNAVNRFQDRAQTITNPDFRPPHAHHPSRGISDLWAAWSTAHNTNSNIRNRFVNLPSFVHDAPVSDTLDSQVKQLLASTVHNLGKGNSQPYDFPYKYILRGPEKVKATINSVTLLEPLWGIFRIIHDSKTDADIKPSLMLHIEQIIEEAREFDWELGVRCWSEEVFSRISEGRLLTGWHAYEEIQRMRMVIAQSKPFVPKQQAPHNYRDNSNKKQLPHNQAQLDILRGGPPCPDYNSSTGCTLSSGHIKQGKRLVHVCSFCLYNTSTANYHPETYYCNKIHLTGSNNHFQ